MPQNLSGFQASPSGPTIYHNRIPISITECMIGGQVGVTPDISSVSDASDGRVLHAHTG